MLKKLLTLILIVFLIFFVILNPKLFSAISQNLTPEIKEDEILLDDVVVKITSGQDDINKAQKKLDAILKNVEKRMSIENKALLETLRREQKEKANLNQITDEDLFYNDEIGSYEDSIPTKIAKVFDSEMSHGDKLFVFELKMKIFGGNRQALSEDLGETLNNKRVEALKALLKNREEIVDKVQAEECWLKQKIEELKAENYFLTKENEPLIEDSNNLADQINDAGIDLKDIKEDLKNGNPSLIPKLILKLQLIQADLKLKTLGLRYRELSNITYSNHLRIGKNENFIYDLKRVIADHYRTPLYTSLERRLVSIDAAISKAKYFCEHQRK